MTGPEAKPAYRLPSMVEIAATPANGLTVVSTFSGAGGSCLGFKMAGYRALYAAEFIAAAAETYRANFPGVPVDERDVRLITGDDVRRLAGVDSIDVLEGSPPCASFSAAGSRSGGWGEVKRYSETAQRTDDLFYEYARLVADLRPRAFVAENVAGLVRGVAKGYFLRIHETLSSAGYVVRAAVLDAQWLGVPQARKRVIIVGIRADLGIEPAFPLALPYRYSVRDALPHLDGHEVGSGGSFGGEKWRSIDLPACTIGRNVYTGNGRSPAGAVRVIGARTRDGVTDLADRRWLSIDELRLICGFPADFILTGNDAQQWERLGRSVPPPMMRAVAATLAEQLA